MKLEAVRLAYRSDLAERVEGIAEALERALPQLLEKSLERGESSYRWVTVIPASQVQHGFWYKIAAGDAETPDYRVQVRTLPLLTGFDITYRFRPYLGWPEQATRNPNLEAHRGTEVSLTVRTNRVVREGQLVLDGEKPLVAELLPEDSSAMRFQLVLENDATYRIVFTSTEGERNTDPMAYTIKVLHDLAPVVELKKPGGDVELPPDGTLRLEGVARDDFGVAGLSLHMKLVDGPDLKSKPYRPGKEFRLADRTYPQILEYKDFVELEKVQNSKDEPAGLKPGQVIALGAVLHELATNAYKYGALSVASGSVELGWALTRKDGVDHVELSWHERGGPRVKRPSKKGLGSRIIQRGLPNATIAWRFAPEGVSCEINLALEAPRPASAPPRERKVAAAPAPEAASSAQLSQSSSSAEILAKRQSRA